MASITTIAANGELVTFVNDPTSDTQCGSSRMLAWTWPGSTAFAQTASAMPLWPATNSNATNATSVSLAVMAIMNMIPSSASLPTTSTDLSALVLDTSLLFSFMMLYNQIALFQGVNNVATDPIIALCIGAVASASAVSVIPCADPTTGVMSLQSTLTSATGAVQDYLSSADMTIPFATTLATLVPRMFTPFWTLSYYSSFGDGRMADPTFYDLRYAPIVLASAFDDWITAVAAAATQPSLMNVSTWLEAARTAAAAPTEGQASLNTYFGTIKAGSDTATSSISTLMKTNAQFERRRGSIGALSDNLHATRRRTHLALITLIMWFVTLILCLAIAGYLISQGNYTLVTVLIIATVILLTLDTLWRGVSSISG